MTAAGVHRRAVLAGLTVLAACGSTPPAPPPAPAPKAPPAPAKPSARGGAERSEPERRAALPEGLAVEQRWLQSWFKGTPVLIAPRDEGLLAVEVPREFCFDAGQAEVKPALAAVLDKVAESLRRRPAAMVAVVAAPGDAGGNGALAQRRAASVYRHLRDRGVAASRLAAPATTTAAAVQLRIGLPSPQ